MSPIFFKQLELHILSRHFSFSEQVEKGHHLGRKKFVALIWDITVFSKYKVVMAISLKMCLRYWKLQSKFNPCDPVGMSENSIRVNFNRAFGALKASKERQERRESSRPDILKSPIKWASERSNRGELESESLNQSAAAEPESRHPPIRLPSLWDFFFVFSSSSFPSRVH